MFPPTILDKHFERLIRFDERLFMLMLLPAQLHHVQVCTSIFFELVKLVTRAIQIEFTITFNLT